MNGTETQAEFYRQAVNAGLEVRLEVCCGQKHYDPRPGKRRSSKACRFDAVVMNADGAWLAIVEAKRNGARGLGTRQLERYAKHGLPVMVVRNMAEISAAVERCLALVGS